MSILEKLKAEGASTELVAFLTVNENNLATLFPFEGFEDRVLAYSKKIVEDTPTDLMAALAVPLLGEKFSLMFSEFARVLRKLPNIKDIIDGKVTTLDPSLVDDISTQYAIVTSLCFELLNAYEVNKSTNYRTTLENDPEFQGKVANVIAYLMDNFCAEINIMAMRTMLAIFRLPINVEMQPRFDEWADKHKPFIVGA